MTTLPYGVLPPWQIVCITFNDVTHNRQEIPVEVVIVAPKKFFPITRIIDYDKRTDRLIKLGYNAAEMAFRKYF